LLEFQHPIFRPVFWPSDRQLLFVVRALYDRHDLKEPTPNASEIKEPTAYTTLVSNVSKHLGKLAKLQKSQLASWKERQIRIVNTSQKEGLHWIVSDITYGPTTIVTLYDPYGNSRMCRNIVSALRELEVPPDLKLHIITASLGLQNKEDNSRCGIISTFIQLLLLNEGTIDIPKIKLPMGWDHLVLLLMYIHELQRATLPSEDYHSLRISNLFQESMYSSIPPIIGKIRMQISNLQQECNFLF